MSSSSPLDLLLSLFSGLARSPSLTMLPNLLFNIAILWFAIVGWKRHRLRGFVMLLVAAVLGLGASILFMGTLASGRNSPSHYALAFGIARQLGSIGSIFFAAGIWHFVYRTRYAPPEPPAQ